MTAVSIWDGGFVWVRDHFPQAVLIVDWYRVIGLTLEPAELLHQRQHRQGERGVFTVSDYTNQVKIHKLIETIETIIRKDRFHQLDVTDEPLETSADQMAHRVKRQLNLPEKADLEFVMVAFFQIKRLKVENGLIMS